MKNSWIGILLFLVSCGGEDTVSDQDLEETTQTELVKYTSVLRPDIEEWNMYDVFTDTVFYVSYNDDGDYAFMTVRTSTGAELNMVTGDFVDDQYLSGNKLVIDWMLDSLYEAGEGDMLYFQERIIDFRPFGDKAEFTAFLRKFSHDYKNNTDLSEYVHPEVSSFYAFNPGAYCVLGTAPEDPNGQFIDVESDYVITDQKPTGDFCEGYEAEPGLYFEFIDKDQFPGYADLSGDQDIIKAITPSLEVEYDKVAKVLVIDKGFFNRHLYFFKSSGVWYLWIEDFCDCSA